MMGEMMDKMAAPEADEHDEETSVDAEHHEEAPMMEKIPEIDIESGVAHLQEAVHALEHNELDEAQKALTEAMELLSPGDPSTGSGQALFEAAEHGLEDIEAGKPDEALTVLKEALTTAGIPLPEEEE